MNDNDLFLRLMDEVENQGGAHLPDVCVGRELIYEKTDNAHTVACRTARRFVVPDLVFVGETQPETPGMTTACFGDDMMASWPRFSGIFTHEVGHA